MKEESKWNLRLIINTCRPPAVCLTTIEDVEDVTIENPITPGEAINEKEYRLDIFVSLNNNTYINIEMQVINYNNWPLRSLAYLCRKFDQLHIGEDYSQIKPVY